MAARDVLKNFNLFVDGRGYAGQIEEFTPPVLNVQTEDFRGGGMDAPIQIQMGMEKLETSFALVAFDKDTLALFGIDQGSDVSISARGALESYDGTVTAVVYTLRGKIKQIDPGTWQPGQKPQLKVMLDLHYYKLQHGDQVIHEIDVQNMIRTINGTDVLALIRGALAI